jgi:hypothetical protein
MADGGDGDPFEGVRFDDDFIRGAAKRELSADERVQRATSARDAHDALLQRAAEQPAKRRRRSGRHGAGWWRNRALFVVVVLVGIVVWRFYTAGGGTNRDWFWGTPVTQQVTGPRPTPAPAVSDRPLGSPAPVSGLSESYDFLATQPGNDEPVAFDPCRPIRYVVNGRTALAGGGQLLTEAVATISAATGLRFELEGPNDEVPIASRAAFQPDRYGDRWAPVLIAWSDPSEYDRLDGKVAGVGGPSSIALPGDPTVHVSVSVVLDGPQIASIAAWPGGWAQARAVLEHELAHLVGLNHVDDPTQLMNESGNSSNVGPQAGDRAGLAKLGSGDCVARL